MVKRVLLVTNYFPPHYTGGAEVVVDNTGRGLIERGVEASVLMVNARMRNESDVRRDVGGVPLHEITFQPHWIRSPWLQVFDPRVYRAALAEIRRARPDLVHVHNLAGASLAPLVACARLGVPAVLTLHDLWLLCPNNMLYRADGSWCDPARPAAGCGQCLRSYDYWGAVPHRRAVFARLVRSARLVISPSQKLIDLHVAAGYDRARFRHVPNGIRPTAGPPVHDDRVSDCVRDRGRFRTLFFAGAVVGIKGIGTLLEALPALLAGEERLRLVVAGTGDERLLGELRRHERAVNLLGQVPADAMRPLYATADLLVVPSLCSENMPMTIAESLTAGTPVLASAAGGIPEMIREGETGYLFPPGDATTLAERALAHLGRPAADRRAMRRRCAMAARDGLSLDLYLDRLQAVYDEAVQG